MNASAIPVGLSSCPEPEELAAFNVGNVSEDRRAAIEEHLARCPNCVAVLEGANDGADSLVAELRQSIPAALFAEEICRRRERLLETMDWAPAEPGDVSREEFSFLPGAEQWGDYRILEWLGRGGMGAVYRALHLHLGKIVAVKVLLPHRVGDPRAVARFRQEMLAVGGLEHPHLVRGLDARQEGDRLLLVMEYLEGCNLTDLLRHRGALPVADACEVIRQAALGLHHAHTQLNLVHRDLKPSNLFLTRSGCVKVLDLGLAHFHQGLLENPITGEHDRMGTADYMAPEQWEKSRAVDIRADLYSLGCTLYELLTGKPPFAGPEYSTDLAKMMAHARESVPPLRVRRAEVPDGLVAVLDRLLAKRPDDRYATPAELAVALEPFAAGARLEQPTDGERAEKGSAALAEISTQETVSAAPTQISRRTRRRWLVLAVGLLMACGLGLAGWMVIKPSPTTLPSRLTIGPLRVLRFQDLGANVRQLGELGDKTYRVLLNDRVEIEAELSEPAYVFLLAFNPTGNAADQEQLYFPDNPHTPPAPVTRLTCPADGQLNLNDGVGLQAFVLVASRQPLPTYAEWRKEFPPVAWKRTPATSGCVWRGDGQNLQRLLSPGDDRGTVVPVAEKSLLEQLGRRLRSAPGVEAVELIAFAVD
jgi:serine/threonine protein kinase